MMNNENTHKDTHKDISQIILKVLTKEEKKSQGIFFTNPLQALELFKLNLLNS